MFVVHVVIIESAALAFLRLCKCNIQQDSYILGYVNSCVMDGETVTCI